MRTIDEVLNSNINGMHYGNRLLLPFCAEILKVSIEDDLIMDFSTEQDDAEYNINDEFTEIYFHKYKSLEAVVTKYEVIKMVVVEVGKDLFDFNEHKKISIDILPNHIAEIKEIEDDQIFID